MNARLGRALGITLAAAIALAGLALTLGTPYLARALDMSTEAAALAYALSMIAGVIVGACGGLLILRWIDVRRARRFRNEY